MSFNTETLNSYGTLQQADSINSYGISPEEFKALSKELGVTQNALENFFKILQQQNIPYQDYDHALRTIAERHLTLLNDLETHNKLPSNSYLEIARNEIANGKTEKAIDILMENFGKNDNDLYIKINLISSRLKNVKTNNLMGIVTRDEYLVECNKISYSLLEFINMLQ